MISVVMNVYLGLIDHYTNKWRTDKVDRKYQQWEEDQMLREEMGFDEKNLKKIPKRRIRNNGARKKHSL